MRKLNLFSLPLALALLVALPLLTSSQYYLHLAIYVLYYIILAASLQILFSTGQVSLAHIAFVGMGAYTSALLTLRLDIPFLSAFLIAGLVPALIALPLGFLTLRVKGGYFAIMTIGLVEIQRALLANYWVDTFGGVMGLRGIPPAEIGLPGLGIFHFGMGKAPYYYFILAFAIISLIIFYRIAHSRIGLLFRSIRERDILSEALGVDIMKFKVVAFALSALFAGMGGSFYAHYVRYIEPNNFSSLVSISFVIFLAVGGRGSLLGPVVGVLAMVAIPELIAPLREYQYMIWGVSLVVIMLFLPGGLITLPQRLKPGLRRLAGMRPARLLRAKGAEAAPGPGVEQDPG